MNYIDWISLKNFKFIKICKKVIHRNLFVVQYYILNISKNYEIVKKNYYKYKLRKLYTIKMIINKIKWKFQNSYFYSKDIVGELRSHYIQMADFCLLFVVLLEDKDPINRNKYLYFRYFLHNHIIFQMILLISYQKCLLNYKFLSNADNKSKKLCLMFSFLLSTYIFRLYMYNDCFLYWHFYKLTEYWIL